MRVGTTRVLMVGLGTIGQVHVGVLQGRDDVEIVGGIDPNAPHVDRFPRFDSLDAALAAGLDPDLVVVATPTDTHVAVVLEAMAGTDALVLSEKPLTRSLAHLAELEAAYPPDVLAARVKVAHHFAFSPEVEWARSTVAAHPEWGTPTRAVCVFHDAYAGFPPERQEVYVSSWVDSGPNQLSLLSAFLPSLRLRSHVDERIRSVTTLDHGGGTTTLMSNWLAADSSKQTTLEYADGAVELRLDHTSLTAVLLEGGAVTEHVGYTGSATRKEAHYLGLYDALLSDADDPRLGIALSRTVTELLDLTARATPDGAPVMSTITASARGG